MIWISFAWTSSAFLEGIKAVTRRFWTDDYAERFWRIAQRNDMRAIACDKSPRFGGKKIGLIRLKRKPCRQRLGLMTDADEKKEGGLWGNAENFIEAMGGSEKMPYVIEFDPIIPKQKFMGK